MSDLNLIIVVAAWLVVVVSIWMIFYFSARIYVAWRIRRDEIATRKQLFIRNRYHSPTREEKV